MLSAVTTNIVDRDDWIVHGLVAPSFTEVSDPRIYFHPATNEYPYQVIQKISQEVDFVIIIAPESDGILERCVKHVAQPEKLLSPDHAFVRLTSDKMETFRRLNARSVPAIPTSDFHDHPIQLEFDFPLVVKPTGGCGSQHVYWLPNVESFGKIIPQLRKAPAKHWLVQPFITGTPISVGILDGTQRIILPPLEQIFDAEPFGNYIGSRQSLSLQQETRAKQLAEKVMNALPATTGYWGIDMILGEDPDGSGDVVVEVNPRITSSYSTVLQTVEFDLTREMLENAKSSPVHV